MPRVLDNVASRVTILSGRPYLAIWRLLPLLDVFPALSQVRLATATTYTLLSRDFLTVSRRSP